MKSQDCMPRLGRAVKLLVGTVGEAAGRRVEVQEA
jgi:hypothetical protein